MIYKGGVICEFVIEHVGNMYKLVLLDQKVFGYWFGKWPVTTFLY